MSILRNEKYGWFRSLTALFLSFVLLAGILSFSCTVSAADDTETDKNWMSYLNDGIPLSQVNLPGTHDSCTQYVSFSYSLRCQDTSVAEQLNNGFRYLDLRVRLAEAEDGSQKLLMCHSFGKCRKEKSRSSEKLYFDDVVSDVMEFLTANPSEFVIFCVKAESDDDDVSQVQSAVQAVMSQYPDKWYTKDTIPTVGDVRGKVVFWRRYDDALGLGTDQAGPYVDWEDQGSKKVVDVPYEFVFMNESQMVWVQDRYHYAKKAKWKAVDYTLETCPASDHAYSLNFLSTAGKALVPHPKKYAKYLNSKFLERDLPGGQGEMYGILIFDFGTAELSRRVYLSNFM